MHYFDSVVYLIFHKMEYVHHNYSPMLMILNPIHGSRLDCLHFLQLLLFDRLSHNKHTPSPGLASSIGIVSTCQSSNLRLTTDWDFFCAMVEKRATLISSNYYQSKANYCNKKEANFTLSRI